MEKGSAVGKALLVDQEGKTNVYISKNDENPMIALHVVISPLLKNLQYIMYNIILY